MNRRKPVPQVRIKTPKFKNEAEEADWWDAHPEVISERGGARLRKEGLERFFADGTRPKRPPTKMVTMRLPVEDLARARRLAARKGLGYQTLVKTLLHEALQRAERT